MVAPCEKGKQSFEECEEEIHPLQFTTERENKCCKDEQGTGKQGPSQECPVEGIKKMVWPDTFWNLIPASVA